MSEPTPAQVKADIAAMFDLGAEDYDRQDVSFFGPVGRWLVDVVAPQPGESVLDLACGRGASLLPAAAAVGASGSVRGVDLAPGMVAALQRDVADQQLRWVELSVGDAGGPPQGPFDVLLCGLGLFFLPDPAAALRAWRAVLAPGGRVGLSVFGAPDTAWDTAFKVLLDHLDAPPHEPHPLFAPGAAIALVAEAGFVDVAEESRTWDVAFSDIGAWWEWAFATGFRRMLSGVADQDRQRVQADMAGQLSAAVGPDGRPHWRPELRVITGSAP
ncbi:MAG: methyltransferase domain-containing protein [Geodermatophilaceae bacterium]|nr:methyltransferase domain-containing protein [Geodermatophilaceae bacterium]